MSDPIVSIIMPTYNRGYIIEKSIKSVLSQTFKDFEFFIIDDGSTDNTKEIISLYQNKDARIQYVRLDSKKGACAARNVGINLAKGRLIAFQDSDVEWFPEKLEQQVNLMLTISDKVGVVYTGSNRVYPSKTIYVPDPLLKQKDGNILRCLLIQNFIDTPASLVRKECFEKAGYFDESLPRFQDWDLFIRIARYYEFKLIDKPLFNSFYLKDSISANWFNLIKASQKIIEKNFDLLQKEKVVPSFKISYFIVWVRLSLRRFL